MAEETTRLPPASPGTKTTRVQLASPTTEATQVRPDSPKTEATRVRPASPKTEATRVRPASPRTEATRVPPASPGSKLRTDDKRRSSEILPGSSTSSGKPIPNYLRASTGSCHEFCKHGTPHEYGNDLKERRPLRKSVTGAIAANGKTGVVKSKPSAEPKIQSPSTMDQEILATTSKQIDVLNEQASSDTTTIASCELIASDGLETTSSAAEKAKQEISVLSENVTVAEKEISLDSSKDSILPKKLTTISRVKPSSRSPSPISKGSSNERCIPGKKSVEGRMSIDGRKARNSVDGKKKFVESTGADPERTQKCDTDSSIAKNADDMNSIEGSNICSERIGFEASTSLNQETSKKDNSFGNAKNNAKSELLKKHVAPPKHKILTMKPSPSLYPSALKPPSPIHPLSGLRSRTIADNQPAEKISTSKPNTTEVVNPSTLKPPSPIHPLSGVHSWTSDDNKIAEKMSTSKKDAKKVGTSTTKSPSSKSFVNGDESTSTKKVRFIRVVSSVKRESKFTVVKAKDPNKHDVQADTVDSAKISLASAKVKVTRNASILPPVPPLSKSTLRSRTSYVPSRAQKLAIDSQPKVTPKDASIAGVRKDKAVDMESKNHGPSKLRVRNTSQHRETTQINRPSLRRRDITGRDVEKSSTSSDRYLLRRPSIGRKKNVQVLFNKVIEETANRLVRTRKSKVLALVGAFETVISIQKKSSAGLKPKAKKISSSSKSSR